MPESTDSLQAKLNAETGKLSWKELERHFARGVVIWVASDLDIVDVAARFVQDDRASVEQWLTDGRVGRPSSEQARSGIADSPVSGPWWRLPGCWCRSSGTLKLHCIDGHEC